MKPKELIVLRKKEKLLSEQDSKNQKGQKKERKYKCKQHSRCMKNPTAGLPKFSTYTLGSDPWL